MDTFVLGDLSEAEAKKYFDQLPCKITKPLFKDIYPVFGGRMFDLEAFVRKWEISKGKMKLEKYPGVLTAIETFHQAIDVPTFTKKHPSLPAPEWTSEQFLQALKVISKDCYVLRRKMESLMGTAAVRSLIRHNLIHYRPSYEFAYDFPEVVNLLTPEHPCECFAMKLFLKEIEKENEQARQEALHSEL